MKKTYKSGVERGILRAELANPKDGIQLPVSNDPDKEIVFRPESVDDSVRDAPIFRGTVEIKIVTTKVLPATWTFPPDRTASILEVYDD
ncbi:MAG TPA: hypothetical protein VMQ44_03890 [Candidatus Saccharimonadales bacterium]|nr:hypothetical protein [Candidatus Saccharimonadales bacterium]